MLCAVLTLKISSGKTSNHHEEKKRFLTGTNED